MRRYLRGNRRWSGGQGTGSIIPKGVVLVIGDSEAGQGGTLNDYPDFYPPTDGRLSYVEQSTFTYQPTFTEPSNPQTLTWGMGGYLAWLRSLQLNRHSIVCNCAVSGTDSTYYKYSTAVPSLSGYSRVIASMQTALAQSGSFFDRVYIYGGANDASGASPALNTNWIQALSDMYAGIGSQPANGVYFVKPPAGPPVAPYNTSWTTMRSQVDALASGGYVTKFDAINGYTWGDIQYVHLAGAGIYSLDRDLAALDGSIAAPDAVTSPADYSGLYVHLQSGTETSTTGALIDSLGNAVGTDAFTATGGTRPTYTASDATWNSKPQVTYGGGTILQSNLTAADWAWLSDGTTYTMYLAWEAAGNCDLVHTNMGGSPGGMLLRYEGTTMKLYTPAASGFGSLWTDPGRDNFSCSLGMSNNRRIFASVRVSATEVSMRGCGNAWVTATYANGRLVGSPPTSCSYALKIGSGFYTATTKMPMLLIYRGVYHTTQQSDRVMQWMKNNYNLQGRFE